MAIVIDIHKYIYMIMIPKNWVRIPAPKCGGVKVPVPWRYPGYVIGHPEIIIDDGSCKKHRLIDIIVSIQEGISNDLHLYRTVSSVFFYFNCGYILK
jgi:hypothetical protein